MKPLQWIAIMQPSTTLTGYASWFNDQQRTTERESVVESLYPQGQCHGLGRNCKAVTGHAFSSLPTDTRARRAGRVEISSFPDRTHA